MDLSAETMSWDDASELISGIAPLLDCGNNSVEQPASESQQNGPESKHTMNPELDSASTASARRKINSSSARNRDRDLQNVSRDEGNGGYSPHITNRYANVSDSQLMSPSLAFSPLAGALAQGQNSRRIGSGIRVQLFRDPDPEGEERVTDEDGTAQKHHLGSQLANENAQSQQKPEVTGPMASASTQKLQHKQLALQESVQLQLQQQLQERHSKLQLQMEQLQLQQQQLQQQEDILQQQQELSLQLKNSIQLSQEDGALALQNHHCSFDSNLPESDGPIHSEAVTDGLSNPETSSGSTTASDTTGGHFNADVAEGGMVKDSRSVTSGDGAEGDASSELPQQSVEDETDGLSEHSRSRHQSQECDQPSMGLQGQNEVLASNFREEQGHQENEVRLLQQAAGSERSGSEVEQLQLDVSSINNSDSEPELVGLHHDGMEALHPDGGTDQSRAEEDEENQSEDAEADQFKLEPEADQSENFAIEHDGLGDESRSRAGRADPLQQLAMAGVGPAGVWNLRLPQADFVGDDSQPEGERGPVQADGEEEDDDGFRPIYLPNAAALPLQEDGAHLYRDGAGMDREVVGMERGGDGAVAAAQVPFLQQQQQQQQQRQQLRQTRSNTGGHSYPLCEPTSESQGSGGARRKTTIGAASKDKKSPPKNRKNASGSGKIAKQSSFPRMGAKAAGSATSRSQGAGPTKHHNHRTLAYENTGLNPARSGKPDSELSPQFGRQGYPEQRSAGTVEGSSFISVTGGPTMPNHLARQGIEISPIKNYSSAPAPARHIQSPGASSARELLQQMQTGSTTNSPGKYSQVQSRDIQNMEQIRDHLQNVLQMSSELPEHSLYDQDAEAMTLVPGMPRSMEGDEVIYPIVGGRALSDVAPNFDSLLSLSKYGTSAQTAALHSRPDVSSLMAENQILRENIEKEKYRRKHCEKHIQQLQTKLLELQQQLAVATSTDRKKDLVIEQLDRTLAKIIEDWKRNETQKQGLIQQLRSENENMKSRDIHQQGMLEKFEHDLHQVVEQLADEQQRATQADAEREAEQVSQEEERRHMKHLLEMERERLQTVELECAQLQEHRERVSRELQDLKKTHADETESWEEREREYLQQVEDMTSTHQKQLADDAAKLQRQSQTLQETQQALGTSQKALQEHQIELDSALREKESLKVQMGLLEAREESSRRKLEADLNAEMETQVRERVAETREQYEQREEQLRERHRTQVLELTQQHGTELERQIQESHLQLQAQQQEHQGHVDQLQERVDALEAELKESQALSKKLESQRIDVTNKLQSMMQSHCNEALRLLQLGSHVLSLSPAKPSSDSSSSIATLTPTISTTTSVTFASSLLEASLLSTLPAERHRQPSSGAVSQLEGTAKETRAAEGVCQVSVGSLSNHRALSNFTAGHVQSPVSASRYRPSSLDDFSHRSSSTKTAQTFNGFLDYHRSLDSVSSVDSPKRHEPSHQIQSHTHSLPPGELMVSQSASGTSGTQAFLLQSPTLRTHGPSYGHSAHSQNSSLHSPSSNSDRGHQVKGQGHFEAERSRPGPSLNGTTSSPESNYNGAFPRKQTAQGSFLSSLLQQAGGTSDDEDREPRRLNDIDYGHISERFEEHEDRQRELQKYIKMLLQRAPGAPTDVQQGQAGQWSQRQHLHSQPLLEDKSPASSPRIVVFSPVKNQTTPPHSRQSPGGASKSRALAHRTAFTRDMDTGGISSAAESVVMKSEQSPKTAKAAKSVGGLSPQQVGEISRLLGIYRSSTESGDGDKPPVQELSAYLQQLQETNEQIHPTKETTSTPPRGARPHSDSSHLSPGKVSRSRRNLEATYDISKPQRHVIRLPSMDGSLSHQHQHQNALPSSASSSSSLSSSAAAAHGHNQTASTKPGAMSRKRERKTVQPGKPPKPGQAWR